jgi:hypothetical protein
MWGTVMTEQYVDNLQGTDATRVSIRACCRGSGWLRNSTMAFQGYHVLVGCVGAKLKKILKIVIIPTDICMCLS